MQLPLINGKQMGSEIGFFVVYSEFFSDVVAVNINGSGRHLQMLSHLFGGLSLFYQVCDLNLGGSEIIIMGR